MGPLEPPFLRGAFRVVVYSGSRLLPSPRPPLGFLLRSAGLSIAAANRYLRQAAKPADFL
jgi:hypothetical protein